MKQTRQTIGKTMKTSQPHRHHHEKTRQNNEKQAKTMVETETIDNNETHAKTIDKTMKSQAKIIDNEKPSYNYRQ